MEQSNIADIAGNTLNSDVNSYLYGGKEIDKMNGLNMYDFSARWLDNAIPVFSTFDPLAYLHPDESPYSFCGGDPVNRIDPTGLTWWRYKDDLLCSGLVCQDSSPGRDYIELGDEYFVKRHEDLFSIVGILYSNDQCKIYDVTFTKVLKREVSDTQLNYTSYCIAKIENKSVEYETEKLFSITAKESPIGSISVPKATLTVLNNITINEFPRFEFLGNTNSSSNSNYSPNNYNVGYTGGFSSANTSAAGERKWYDNLGVYATGAILTAEDIYNNFGHNHTSYPTTKGGMKDFSDYKRISDYSDQALKYKKISSSIKGIGNLGTGLMTIQSINRFIDGDRSFINSTDGIVGVLGLGNEFVSRWGMGSKNIGPFVAYYGFYRLLYDFVAVPNMNQYKQNILSTKHPLDDVYCPGLGDYYTPFLGKY